MTSPRARRSPLSPLPAGLLLAALPLAVPAAELSVGAFASLTAGRLVEGARHGPLGPNPAIQCPCNVVDWANRGIYEGKSWQLEPDSKAGAQLIYRPGNTLGLTTQLIARGQAPAPDLEWAYLSWSPRPDWQLDVGRKRLPLYFYSEFQDVGTAYPWVSPPGEVYGWETTNYNGASLRYRGHWQALALAASLFGGQEQVSHNPYMEVFYNVPTDTRWDDIRGADLEASQDWWTARGVYLQANTRFDDGLAPWTEDLQAYGAAFNAQQGRWQFLSEAGVVARRDKASGDRLEARFYSLGAGYEFLPRWSVFANVAAYDERYTDPTYQYVRFDTRSLTLQYRLGRRHNLKLQYDDHQDHSFDFMGDSTLVRLSWNMSYWSPNLLRAL